MDKGLMQIVLLILGGFVLLVLMVWGFSAQEAKTFNKLTGSEVTAWDAMWVELRVDRPVEKVYIVKEAENE